MSLANFQDLNAKLVNHISFLVGIVLIITGVLTSSLHTDLSVILISVGSSMLASSMVVYMSSKYLIRQKSISKIIEEWGLKAIYYTRSEMNRSADEQLDVLKYEIDIIAFGLKAFRHAVGDIIEEKVKRGLKLRILTISPLSSFVKQRELDEGEVDGQIQKTITDLQAWVQKLKKISPYPKNIEIKFYDNLPLESYMRTDNSIYTGPYLYNKPSQQTISYEYRKPSRGFDYWNNYFLELWNDPEFTREDYNQFY